MYNTYTVPEGTARAGVLGGRRAAPSLRPLSTLLSEEQPREAQLQTPRGQWPFPALMPGPLFPAWASVPNVEWKHLWGSGRVSWPGFTQGSGLPVHPCTSGRASLQLGGESVGKRPQPRLSCSTSEPRPAPWRRGHRRGRGQAMAPDPHRHSAACRPAETAHGAA